MEQLNRYINNISEEDYNSAYTEEKQSIEKQDKEKLSSEIIRLTRLDKANQLNTEDKLRLNKLKQQMLKYKDETKIHKGLSLTSIEELETEKVELVKQKYIEEQLKRKLKTSTRNTIWEFDKDNNLIERKMTDNELLINTEDICNNVKHADYNDIKEKVISKRKGLTKEIMSYIRDI